MMTRKHKTAKLARIYGLGAAGIAAAIIAGTIALHPGGFELSAGPVFISSGPAGINTEFRTKSDFRLTITLAGNRRIHLK